MTRRSFLLLAGIRHLTSSLSVTPGPVNSVILSRKGRRLAFYCGAADQVLLTHFRRDVCCAAADASAVVAPRAEAGLIADPQSFWRGVDKWRYHDYAMVNTKVLTAPLPVRRTVAGGDRIQWQDVDIEVLDTPGYTPGAVSYLFQSGGRRIACVGDLIYGDGQLLDLWSLQDAIPAAKLRGYHGYAARGHELISSLRALAARQPDLLIPSRGPVIRNPAAAIETLIGRLKIVFREHFSTDALRWYFGDDNLKLRAARLLEGATPEWMPMAEKRDHLPAWLHATGNSRLLLSDSGSGFLVDCGYDKVIQEMKKLRQEGRLRALEGIFITHYHDDHTDRAQACATEFGCPVYYCAEQRPILSQPKAFRMPCLSPFPIRDGKPMRGGEKLNWREFELTFNYFPGQTLYHGSLLARRSDGQSVLFAGDSFTPSGTDDYCLWNRDFLSPGAGFAACFAQLRKLPPNAWVANQHVAPLFRFSAEQLDYMERSFARRRQAMRDLFPWPDVNFGIDHQWARLSPYEVDARAGIGFDLQAVIWNHGPSAQEFTVRPHLPAGWTSNAREYRLKVPAGKEGAVAMRVQAGTTSGRHVITADVAFGKWDLPQWMEALVNVA